MGSGQQGVLMDEDSCGFADHMNEYDEKLNTFTIKEEDQRSILIIGGTRHSYQTTKSRPVHMMKVKQ